MTWIAPNTITGDAATDGRYLRRDLINEQFWLEVQKGNHILFVAPRRVGKTSIMLDLEKNHPEGFACLYQNIEGVKTMNEFYERLVTIIMQCVSKSKTQTAIAFVTAWIKKTKIEEITASGIKFGSVQLDYEHELRELISNLKDTGIHTVIFLDEFAEVISKLNKTGCTADAIDILHTLREIRSNKNFDHFTIVFAGSVGLDYVVRTLDRPKLINDLRPIDIPSLSSEQATSLIEKLVNNATITFSAATKEYLLQKISHLLPYFIQLMLEEIDQVARHHTQPEITNEFIDQAFDRVLQKNKNFDDWHARLKDYQAESFPFINHILIHIAHRGHITIQEVYDLAGQDVYKRRDDYMDFILQLTSEGYLIETSAQRYQFISPFLKQFWLRKFPIYD